MGVLAVVVFILVHPLKAHRIYLRVCRLNMLLLLFCSKFSAIRGVYNERRRETKILKVTICGGGALFYLEER